MKSIRFLLPFLVVNFVIAQHTTTGKLEAINQDGLHEIRLPNEIRSFSKRDLSDLRIFDSTDKEVPYFIRKKDQKLKTSEYKALEIVSKTIRKDTSSSIIFKNSSKVIKNIILTVANYSGSKTFKILGSNNESEWFGILNNGHLSNLQSDIETSVDKEITFPQCEYRYLKILFNNQESLPINVLKIGTISKDIKSRNQQVVISKTQTISELIDKKKTQIHVVFKNKEIINQVEFKVLEPELFNRYVTMYKVSEKIEKNKKETYNEQLARFKLNSEKKTIFNIPEIFEDDIYIEIENKDSNSLTFSEINFFQKPLYLIASLKKDENYIVKTGNKKAKKPEYDLSFFRNNISEDLLRVKIQDILTTEDETASVKQESLWQKPWFMWLCIAITGLIVLFFTSSLVKDLKKDKD